MRCGGGTKKSDEAKRGDRGEDAINCLMLGRVDETGR